MTVVAVAGWLVAVIALARLRQVERRLSSVTTYLRLLLKRNVTALDAEAEAHRRLAQLARAAAPLAEKTTWTFMPDVNARSAETARNAAAETLRRTINEVTGVPLRPQDLKDEKPFTWTGRGLLFEPAAPTRVTEIVDLEEE